jgi:hypothetical protein
MAEPMQIFYGIWIPGTGWLRGDGERALMFTEKAVAQETARRVGQKAKVYFIDNSLVDIEAKLLDAEKRNTQKWRTYVFLNWLGDVTSKVMQNDKNS